MAEKSFNPIDNIVKRDLINSFCLFDDLYMSAFFDDNIEGIEQVLRIVLEKPDIKVLSVIPQAFAANLANHSVYFDVLAKDSNGKLLDIEVQRASAGASPKRARFHSSMIDAKSLAKAASFDDLPESWVIFITEKDVIGLGQPLYLYERKLQGTDISLGDESFIVYVNGALCDDSPLGRLMHDFACTKADQMYYNILAERTRFFKETLEGEVVMNEVLEKYKTQLETQLEHKILEKGIAIGKSEGVAIGKSEGIDNTIKAISLIKADKYAIEEIASLSGLSVEKVKALQTELSSKA